MQLKYMKMLKCSFNENGKKITNKYIYRTAETLQPELQSNGACSMLLFFVC